MSLESPPYTASSPESEPEAVTRTEVAAEPRRGARWPGLLAFAVAAAATATGYALFTNHIWEDFFITFRHSRNLVEGHGLVFTPGEYVHGFTSPLGVLLPALCYYVMGSTSYIPALWLFRALSIVAYVGAGILLIRGLADDGHGSRREGAWFGLFYVLQVNILDYSINGMEAAFLALFVAWGFVLLARGIERRWLPVGLCWAGLMWTRPDGFVYVAILAMVALAFHQGPRRGLGRSLFRAATVCTVLYLPWFAWAWWYYGSPVPHTVTAKSSVELSFLVHVKSVIVDFTGRYFTNASKAFLPILIELGPDRWHPGLGLVTKFLAGFCATYWALPVRERLGRMASACFALLCLYFACIPIVAYWYLPPVSMLGLVALVRGVPTIALEIQHRRPQSVRFALVLLGLLAAERALWFGQTAYQMRVQQTEIEMRTRAEVGKWLKDRVKPGERVYLEPLGYIGYFSGARMRDWPGLVSPEIVRLRREKQCNFLTIVPELRPEWMVLRPGEADKMAQIEDFVRNYSLEATFDARPRLAEYRYIPGRGYLLNDAVFRVYRRSDAARTPAGANGLTPPRDF